MVVNTEPNILTIDIECSMLPVINPWQHGSFICSIGFAYNDNPVQTVVLRHATEPVPPQADSLALVQSMIDASDIIVAHNAKFDLNWLKHIGLKFDNKKIWCTQVADYLINGQYRVKYSLNAVASRYNLGSKEDGMAKYWDDGINTDEIPLDIHIPYLIQDVQLTRDVYNIQKEIIKSNGLGPLAALCFEVTDILSDMESYGIYFDIDKANNFLKEYKIKLDEVDEKLYSLFGERFNIGSSDQLSAYLYGGNIVVEGKETYYVQLKSGALKMRQRKCKLFKSIKGTGIEPLPGSEGAKQGKYSTDKKTLALLRAETAEQKEILSTLVERSKIAKIIEIFCAKNNAGGLINKVGIDGSIHPNFNQTVTVSGRLSSSNPNGQNLPRKGGSPVKSCFIPRNGVIINIDLAQIEFRIAAELSRDEVMLHEIKNGLDTHSDNAIRFFGAGKYDKNSEEFTALRQVAKIFTFRSLYGGGPNGFFRDGSMPKLSLSKWKKIIADYNEKYSGLSKWQQHNVDLVYKQGYLRNPSGRILRFATSNKHGVIGYEEADIYNYPVQSSSTDVMFLAMAVLRKRFKDANLKSKFMLQVHDSLVIDSYPEEVDIICDLAIKTFRELPNLCFKYWGWNVDVPLDGDCEVGLTYGDTVKYVPCLTATQCMLTGLHNKEIVTRIISGCTNYEDLIKHEDYVDFIQNYKLTKIKFGDN